MKYQLLDSGHFKKYEALGSYRIIRPSASAPWPPHQSDWRADAVFSRLTTSSAKPGDGIWKYNRPPTEKDLITEVQGVKMQLKLTDFGHVGLFPEHHTTDTLALCEPSKADASDGASLQLLNLFAYTGFASLKAVQAGWHVAHVDASKTSLAWAKANAALNGWSQAPIRWYCDDVLKFVQREIKRGKRYHGIVLDPPSYGRGAQGEVWKIETQLQDLLSKLQALQAEDFRWIQLSAHTPGYTPLALENLLKTSFVKPGQRFQCSSFEMFVPEVHRSIRMPAGACCVLKVLP